MILVISMLSLASMQIFLLGRWMNLMLLQTNFEYAQNCQRNLLESGYQWACVQKAKSYSNDTIVLNTEMFGQNTSLNVNLNSRNNTAEIQSHCVKGNAELTRSDVYQTPKIVNK